MRTPHVAGWLLMLALAMTGQNAYALTAPVGVAETNSVSFKLDEPTHLATPSGTLDVMATPGSAQRPDFQVTRDQLFNRANHLGRAIFVHLAPTWGDKGYDTLMHFGGIGYGAYALLSGEDLNFKAASFKGGDVMMGGSTEGKAHMNFNYRPHDLARVNGLLHIDATHDDEDSRVTIGLGLKF